MSTEDPGAFEHEDQTHRQAVALALAAHARGLEPEFVANWVRDDWLTDADVAIAVLRARGWAPPPAGRDLSVEPAQVSKVLHAETIKDSWALEFTSDGTLFKGWNEQGARRQYERGENHFSALFKGNGGDWREVERRRPAHTRLDT